MSEQEFEELNQLDKELQASELYQTEQTETIEAHTTPHLVATAFQSLSKIISRKVGIEEIALTDEDVEDLEKALEPLDLSVLEKISAYLPLTLFVVGYSIRVMLAIQEKRKLKIEEAKPQLQKEVKKDEGQGGNTRNSSPKE